MPYNIVTATMKHDSTQETVLNELDKKVDDLIGKGWICLGTIVYFKNSVSQVMIPVSTRGSDVAEMQPEIERHMSLGSFEPKQLIYAMGGNGHMGVHTQFKNGMYYDY
jgi:hypothetical protein